MKNSGLHRPNSFLCPLDVIKLAPKLTRDELVDILRLLAGEEVNEKELNKLREIKILDEHNFIIWQESKESIRLVKEKIVITNEEKVRGGTAFDLIDTLSEDLQTLWKYYVADLNSKHLSVSEGHFTNWLKRINSCMEHPYYAQALQVCLDKRIGASAYLEAIIKNHAATQDKLWSEVE